MEIFGSPRTAPVRGFSFLPRVGSGRGMLPNPGACFPVTNPYNCPVGCQACINVCPVQAISFPTKEELQEIMRALRTQME